jgi:hypothetical protein
MKFMLLMNVKPGPYHIGKWAPEDVKRMIDYMHQLNKDLKAKGQFVAAEGLFAPDQARIVKANDGGSPSITDGPYAESKEFIAGFWMIEVDSADEAYGIAARASAQPGPGGKPLNMPIEVRQVGSPPPQD